MVGRCAFLLFCMLEYVLSEFVGPTVTNSDARTLLPPTSLHLVASFPCGHGKRMGSYRNLPISNKMRPCKRTTKNGLLPLAANFPIDRLTGLSIPTSHALRILLQIFLLEVHCLCRASQVHSSLLCLVVGTVGGKKRTTETQIWTLPPALRCDGQQWSVHIVRYE